MMDDILRDFLHKFVVVYLDDIFAYNRTLVKDVEHLRLVLQRFEEEGLKLRLHRSSRDGVLALHYVCWQNFSFDN
jgi:hypothetical protein